MHLKRFFLLLAALSVLLAPVPTWAQTGPTSAKLIAHDTSGYERHSGVGGNGTLANGALRLNGSFWQTAPLATSTTAQTIAFRVVLNSTSGALGGSSPGLWHDGSAATSTRFFIGNGTTGTLTAMPVASAHASLSTSPLGITTNQSYVIAWRFQYGVAGANYSAISVDGADWANTTANGPLASSTSGPKYVGVATLSGTSGAGNLCNCTFYWMRYYDRALNDTELDALGNGTAPRTGLQLEYLYDETWDYGPPLPSFTSAAANLTLNVDASPSSSPWPNGSLSYSWSWGDSTGPGTNQTDSHRYRDEGNYVVTLTITDAASNQTATRNATIYVPRNGVTTLETAFDSYIPLVLWGGLFIFCLWLTGERVSAWLPAALALLNLMATLPNPDVYSREAAVMLFTIGFVLHALVVTTQNLIARRESS